MNLLKVLLLALFAISVTACNTVQGIGQDVGAAGNAIEHAAEEVEEEIDGD